MLATFKPCSSCLSFLDYRCRHGPWRICTVPHRRLFNLHMYPLAWSILSRQSCPLCTVAIWDQHCPLSILVTHCADIFQWCTVLCDVVRDCLSLYIIGLLASSSDSSEILPDTTHTHTSDINHEHVSGTRGRQCICFRRTELLDELPIHAFLPCDTSWTGLDRCRKGLGSCLHLRRRVVL